MTDLFAWNKTLQELTEASEPELELEEELNEYEQEIIGECVVRVVKQDGATLIKFANGNILRVISGVWE